MQDDTHNPANSANMHEYSYYSHTSSLPHFPAEDINLLKNKSPHPIGYIN